jgi:hypothetical protein
VRAPAPAGVPHGPRERAAETSLALVLALLLALRALASLSSSSWIWGLNTLRAWPAPWPALLPALAALAFVPAVARAAERPLGRAGDALSRPGAAPALLAALVAGALFALRDPLLFTGDSGARASLVASPADVAAITPQIAPLDLLVNVRGARALMGAGLSAATALQAIGALYGALFTLAVVAFLRESGARGAGWVAAAAVVLGGGSLVHLAGYGKYGALLVGLALAAAGVARLARAGRGAWTLAAGLVLALPGHRSAYALLPAAAWAFAAGWSAAPRGRARLEVALAGAAVAAVALALLPHTLDVLLHYDRGVNLVGSATAGRIEPWRQAANVLDALFLLGPLWPAGVVALIHLRRRTGGERPHFPLAGVAALALAGELAVMLVTRGKQGPLRDWDNQVGPALLVTLITAGALVALWRRIGTARTAAPVLASALVASLALWGIHADAGIGGRRVATLLEDPAAWNPEEWAQAHDFVGQRAFAAGRFEEAARAYRVAVARMPSPRMLDDLAAAEAMAGHHEAAQRALERAMAVPQSSGAMWAALGQVALTVGDSARARVCADSARGRIAAVAAPPP